MFRDPDLSPEENEGDAAAWLLGRIFGYDLCDASCAYVVLGDSVYELTREFGRDTITALSGDFGPLSAEIHRLVAAR